MTKINYHALQIAFKVIILILDVNYVTICYSGELPDLCHGEESNEQARSLLRCARNGCRFPSETQWMLNNTQSD